MTVKPNGGESCAANPSADHGEEVFSEGGEANFAATRNHTFETAGSYLLCAWLLDLSSGEAQVAASTSASVAVRQPHLSISLAAPPIVRPNQIFQVTASAQAETARTFYTYILPVTGRGCPANASSADQTAGQLTVVWAAFGDDWNVNGGPFAASANEQLASVGSYLICAYAEYQSTANNPEATANATFAVVKPPPACVVPHLARHTTLASVKRRLLAAHCAIGKVTYIFSSHHRRGEAISTNPRYGAHRNNGAQVAVLVSRGPRHRHH